MEYIYLKETPTEKVAYTYLTELLRSEGIGHVYNPVRKILLTEGKFFFNSILISKIKLTHGKRK